MNVDGERKVLHFADADELKKKRPDLFPRYEKLAKMGHATAKGSATVTVKGNANGKTSVNDPKDKEGGFTKTFSHDLFGEDDNEVKDTTSNVIDKEKAEAQFPEFAKMREESANQKAKMRQQLKDFLKQNPDADTYSLEKSSSSHEVYKSNKSSKESFGDPPSKTKKDKADDK